MVYSMDRKRIWKGDHYLFIIFALEDRDEETHLVAMAFGACDVGDGDRAPAVHQ